MLYNTRHGRIEDFSWLSLIGFGLLFWCGASGKAAAVTLCVNSGGTSGCKSTISAAVTAASPGDTIKVAQGTYKEQVTISKSLSVIASDDKEPTIDATGLPNGIFINGMSKAPNPGVANVLISGLTIKNANFEGILVVNASDVTIVDTHVVDNNKALDIAASTCPGMPAFETNEGDDCGEGIHLMAVDHSSVVRNESDHNSGGLLITDETGPSHDNLISGNKVHDNPYDCGITLASHPPATTVIPSATLPYGVLRNTVVHNVSVHNGTQVPGAGAGVGIFAAFPGTTATANVIINNDLLNNGLPGVTLHNHAAAPAPAPPINLNDNIIVGNHFSGNEADTEDAATSGPTGINIFTLAPITGTVISQNTFDDEAIDVAFKAPSGQISVHFNDFDTRGIGVDNLGTGTINATENWWNCPTGPGGQGCTTVRGSGVLFTPWLTSAFESKHW
jgi:nitrous oxidase accessory protein NosD